MGQAAKDVEESGLTAARGADDGDKFALLDVKGDVFQSRATLVGVRLSDVIEVDHWPITRGRRDPDRLSQEAGGVLLEPWVGLRPV